MSGLGPFAGQNHHFRHYAPEKYPYAIDRYVRETGRLYAVLNKRLADRSFIVGDYSIADIACYPWVQPVRQGQDIADFPHLERWLAEIKSRPAVERAYALAPEDQREADDHRRKVARDPVRPEQGQRALAGNGACRRERAQAIGVRSRSAGTPRGRGPIPPGPGPTR